MGVFGALAQVACWKHLGGVWLADVHLDDAGAKSVTYPKVHRIRSKLPIDKVIAEHACLKKCHLRQTPPRHSDRGVAR